MALYSLLSDMLDPLNRQLVIGNTLEEMYSQPICSLYRIKLLEGRNV
jgi:hypothetical protein